MKNTIYKSQMPYLVQFLSLRLTRHISPLMLFWGRLMPFLFLILWGLPQLLTAQTPAIQWQKVLGGVGDESAKVIQQTTDGGYIVGGTTNSSNSGDVAAANHGGNDFWVVKLNASGAVQWQKVLGGAGSEVLTSIQQAVDGGYIMAGYSIGSSNSGDVLATNQGNADAWVVKINETGTIQWQTLIGGSETEFVSNIRQTTDGGYIMGGHVAGSPEVWVVKLSVLGVVQWERLLRVGQEQGIRDIQATTDGGAMFVAFSRTDKLFTWVAKLDATGTTQWEQFYNVGFWPSAIRQTTDGGFVIGGFMYPLNMGEQQNAGVIKMDATGTIQWQKSLGGSGEEDIKSIQQTTDGGYIVAGYTLSSNSGDVGSNHGGKDAWVVKLNATGTIQWQKLLGGSSDEILESVVPTSDDGYIMAGYTYSSNSGDVGTNHSALNADAWVVKLKLAAACTFTPTISGSSSACIGSTINLTGSATTGTFQWSSVNTSIARVSQTGVVTLIGGGTTDINYTVTQGGCTAVATKAITVNTPGVPDVTLVNPAGTFISGSITLNNLPTGASSALDNGAFTVGKTVYAGLAAGVYKVKMQLNGCISSKDVTLTTVNVNLDPNKCYRIVNKVSNKSLEVKGLSQSDAAQIYQWTTTNNNSQLWRFVKLADGRYNIVSVASGKMMDIQDNTPAGFCLDGTIIQQFTADGTGSQKWRLEIQPDFSIKIYNNNCNKPLRLESGSFVDGASVGIKTDFGAEYFKWDIQETPCSTPINQSLCYRIVNKATNKVLEVKDGSLAQAAQIYQWSSTVSGKRQLWEFQPVAGGFYKIASAASGKLMDVDGACTEGMLIKQFTFDNTGSQNWQLLLQADGFYKILNASCPKYLRVEGPSFADGANVGIKNDFGTDAFKWSLQAAHCVTGEVLSATNASFGFEARASEGRAKLQWVTNTSYKTDYFEIERLNANGNFDIIGKQNTEGGNDMKSYTFTDNNPLDGDNFYRINSVSNGNGPPQYSEVKKVTFSKTDGVSIYPNPADDYIAVDLRKYEGKTVALSFYNSVGFLIKKQTIEKASTAPQRVDVQGFGNGSYLIRVQSEGKREVTQLFNIAK